MLWYLYDRTGGRVGVGVLHVRGEDAHKVYKVHKENGLSRFEESANRHVSISIVDQERSNVQKSIYLVVLL